MRLMCGLRARTIFLLRKVALSQTIYRHKWLSMYILDRSTLRHESISKNTYHNQNAIKIGYNHKRLGNNKVSFFLHKLITFKQLYKYINVPLLFSVWNFDVTIW